MMSSPPPRILQPNGSRQHPEFRPHERIFRVGSPAGGEICSLATNDRARIRDSCYTHRRLDRPLGVIRAMSGFSVAKPPAVLLLAMSGCL